MEINKIKIGTDYFYKICNYLEEDIVDENLYYNGGTLNFNNLTYNSDILLVAFNNNMPVGFNSIVINDDNYYIYQIAVKKIYQHQGIGTELLKMAIEIAQNNNGYVSAHIRSYNKHSQSLFLKLGFQKQDDTSNSYYVLNLKNKVKKKQT